MTINLRIQNFLLLVCFFRQIVILATCCQFTVQSLVGRKLNLLNKQKFYESFLNYISSYFPCMLPYFVPTLNTFGCKEV